MSRYTTRRGLTRPRPRPKGTRTLELALGLRLADPSGPLVTLQPNDNATGETAHGVLRRTVRGKAEAGCDDPTSTKTAADRIGDVDSMATSSDTEHRPIGGQRG